MNTEFDFDVVICSAEDKEYGFALGKAKQESKLSGRCLFIYSDGLFYRMTTGYVERNRVLAKVFPGGRIISWKEEKDRYR